MSWYGTSCAITQCCSTCPNLIKQSMFDQLFIFCFIQQAHSKTDENGYFYGRLYSLDPQVNLLSFRVKPYLMPRCSVSSRSWLRLCFLWQLEFSGCFMNSANSIVPLFCLLALNNATDDEQFNRASFVSDITWALFQTQHSLTTQTWCWDYGVFRKLYLCRSPV